ncbi:MAG: SDR family NAD(P)-dependent oxidoreductase [Rhodospirillales bacterium]|nr:SDR family NAD(P)-dependent oxidoreductase [Rhodospirillales bacterium]
MTHFAKPARSILITGASSGIGEALAREFAAPGVHLALSGRNAGRLQAIASACRDRGAEVAADTVDVTDRDAMNQWIADMDRTRLLDLVVANAGISAGSGGRGESAEQAREIFAVNLAGVLNTVLPAIPLMQGRKTGQIAIMSSLAGLISLPGAPSYAASKAAVRSYGEALRGLLAEDGIRVSVICPGFVESRITANNPFPMPFLMNAAKAAGIIRRGLERDKARIAFPWPLVAAIGMLNALPLSWSGALLRRTPRKV